MTNVSNRLPFAVMMVLVLMTPADAAKKRPVVGIAEIGTAAHNVSCRGWKASRGQDCNHYLTEGFRVMLETAIVKGNKMRVMERIHLGHTLQEQGLAQMGLTTAGGEVGGLTGVDYLIYGSITKFGARKSGASLSGGVANVFKGSTGTILGAGAGIVSSHAVMAVDVKVTEVSTGRIILADTVEAEAKTGEAMSFGGFSTVSETGDPFADVQRQVAARLAEAVTTVHIPFKIIKASANGTLIINYGNAYLSPGDRLITFASGEEIVDPDTGEVLGSEATETGVVEIVSAETRYSRAKIISGTPEVGGVLKRAKIRREESETRSRSGGSFLNEEQSLGN